MWDQTRTVEQIADACEPTAGVESIFRPVEQPPRPGAVPFIEVEHDQCRWPLWEHESEAKLVCGSPQHSTATSYCREHWIASGRAHAGRPLSPRSLPREPKAVACERVSLLTLQRNEGF